MKRGSVNPHQSHGSVGNSKLAHKFKSLLEDYLAVQKECVSKKRKVRAEKQKRDILLDEVRFLKQRYKYFIKLKSSKVEPEHDLCQNANIHDMPIREKRNYIGNETNIKQEGNEREELVWKTKSTEKPINFTNGAKKIGK